MADYSLFVQKARERGIPEDYIRRKILGEIAKEQMSTPKLDYQELPQPTNRVLSTTTKSQDKGFRITDLLPVAGGILGAIGGGAIGSVLPGPGTAVGGITGGGAGSAAGEFLRQAIEGEEADTRKITTEGAFGLAGGVAGKVIGKGGSLVAKSLMGTGKGLQKAVVNPKVVASPFAAVEEKTIVEGLRKLGLTGSAQGIREKMPSVFTKLSDDITTILNASKASMKTADVTAYLDDAIRNNINFDALNPTYSKAATKFLNQVVSQANKGKTGLKLDAKALFGLKQNLGKQLSRAFDKVERGIPLTDKEDVGLTVWGSLDDLITKLEPQVKELTKLQSILYKSSPGLAEAAKKGTHLTILGTPLPIPTGAVQGAASGTGRSMEGLGKAGLKAGSIVSPTLGQTLARTPKLGESFPKQGAPLPAPEEINQERRQAVLDLLSQGIYNPQEIADTLNQVGKQSGYLFGDFTVDEVKGLMAQTTDQNFPSAVPVRPDQTSGFTKEKLAQLMLAYPKQAGTWKYLYEVYNPKPEKKPAEKPKTEAQVAREDTVALAEDALDFINNKKIKTGPIEAPIEDIKAVFNAGDPDTLTFNRKIMMLKAAIAKARAGTSFTPNEEKLLNSYTPMIGDSQQMITIKLSNIVQFFKNKASKSEIGPNEVPVIPEYEVPERPSELQF